MKFILHALLKPMPGVLTLALLLGSWALAATPFYYGYFHVADNGATVSTGSTPCEGVTGTAFEFHNSNASTHYVTGDTSGNVGICGALGVVGNVISAGTVQGAHILSGDLAPNLPACTNGSSFLTTTGCTTGSNLSDPFTVGGTTIGTALSGTVAGVTPNLLGFKSSGTLHVAFDTSGNVGAHTVNAAFFASSGLATTTDAFLCVNSSGILEKCSWSIGSVTCSVGNSGGSGPGAYDCTQSSGGAGGACTAGQVCGYAVIGTTATLGANGCVIEADTDISGNPAGLTVSPYFNHGNGNIGLRFANLSQGTAGYAHNATLTADYACPYFGS